MFSENATMAFNEFIDVGLTLVIIIAAISIVAGIVREYIPQAKIQKKLMNKGRWGSAIGAGLGTLTPF